MIYKREDGLENNIQGLLPTFLATKDNFSACVLQGHSRGHLSSSYQLIQTFLTQITRSHELLLLYSRLLPTSGDSLAAGDRGWWRSEVINICLLKRINE